MIQKMKHAVLVLFLSILVYSSDSSGVLILFYQVFCSAYNRHRSDLFLSVLCCIQAVTVSFIVPDLRPHLQTIQLFSNFRERKSSITLTLLQSVL